MCKTCVSIFNSAYGLLPYSYLYDQSAEYNSSLDEILLLHKFTDLAWHLPDSEAVAEIVGVCGIFRQILDFVG